MNTITILRQELRALIDEIPAQRLPALKPLLADLAEPDYHIETDLTEEERTLIKDSMKRYHADPSSFVSLDDLKKKLDRSRL